MDGTGETLANDSTELTSSCQQSTRKPEVLARLRPGFYAVAKRAFDLTVSIMALPVVALVSAVLLIVNPFANPGPLIFSQRRVGRHGKPFKMYKFRSMVGEARQPLFATQETERITGLGKILRKQRLDELPQFINILKGEMSLIGPRPEQVSIVKLYTEAIPNFHLRHEALPGITGLAQVQIGYADDADSAQKKLYFDLEYIRNAGFILDLKIALRTIFVILSGFGAR